MSKSKQFEIGNEVLATTHRRNEQLGLIMDIEEVPLRPQPGLPHLDITRRFYRVGTGDGEIRLFDGEACLRRVNLCSAVPN